MIILARPLSSFPGPETPTAARKRAPFVQRVGLSTNPVSLSQTLDELDRELRLLGVTEAVLEMDVSERDIRRDGEIRADARPRTPRVVLSFSHPQAGPLRYPCDTYQRWQDNIRALRLALEALRAVDRYGITRRAEQYAGWRALPAQTSATLTVEAAARLAVANDPTTALQDSKLAGEAVKLLLRSSAAAKVACRRALAAAHPDHAGPAREDLFKLLGNARQVLDAHHGGGVA